MFTFILGQRLSFPYKNYRGEISSRNVIFLGLDYGMNEWYPEDQWFMRCFDLDKGAYRSFALKHISPRSIKVVG
jgi:predicted DNA-binding transcriptional regulator YafY